MEALVWPAGGNGLSPDINACAQNRAGKTRLAKYYVPLADGEKHSLEYDVHRLISTRDPKFTNFVEVEPTLPTCVSIRVENSGLWPQASCDGAYKLHRSWNNPGCTQSKSSPAQFSNLLAFLRTLLYW